MLPFSKLLWTLFLKSCYLRWWLPLSFERQRQSSDDCLEDNVEHYQSSSMLCYMPKLCSSCYRWLLVYVFRSNVFDRVDLIKPVSNVRPFVRTCVRTSIRPQKVSSIFMKFGTKDRGRWVMLDGMQYDPIQGQGQGHKLFKVGYLVIFRSYLLRLVQCELATDHWFVN